jgi:hypothetical protein
VLMNHRCQAIGKSDGWRQRKHHQHLPLRLSRDNRYSYSKFVLSCIHWMSVGATFVKTMYPDSDYRETLKSNLLCRHNYFTSVISIKSTTSIPVNTLAGGDEGCQGCWR